MEHGAMHREPVSLEPLSRDYERVAEAIRYLDRHYAEQPSLGAVASHVGLSPYHFQRLFSRWAGTSPKRFGQFVTLAHARRRLTAGEDLLSVSDGTGLSGPGRLHDLFVTIEAMTPGEFKRGGERLRIRFGIQASPFGPLLAGVTERGICWLGFCDGGRDDPLDALRATWPRATLERDEAAVRALVDRIFPAARRSAAPVSLHVQGTNFQLRVWRALLEVAPGRLVSYGGLAGRIGAAGSARAVGRAVAANPVALLIPCHRVIRGTGHLGGYRWGETRKRAIAAREALRAPA